MKIRPLQKEDWEAVRRIYQEGMDTGLATLEVQAPDWANWNAKFLEKCRLVVEENNQVIAWATLSEVSKRYVYRGVAEVTIYVSLEHLGKGVGTLLLKALVEASEKENFWTLQSVIFPENVASIRLHERFGFRIVGKRERIAQRHGKWMDTVLMERRSNLIN